MIQSVMSYKGWDIAHLADEFAHLSQRAICTCFISSRGRSAADQLKVWTFLDEKGFSKT